MSIQKIINKYINPAKPPVEVELADKYASYIRKTTAMGPTISSTSNTLPYQAMPGMSTNTTGDNLWEKFIDEKDNEKLLTKIGFNYDHKNKEWVLELSSEIRIPKELGIKMLVKDFNDTPYELAILKIKKLKKMFVEKITAKLILAELVKPRDIKE